MPAGETPTSADERFEPTTVSPMPERAKLKGPDDRARRIDPRSTEVFRERGEKPDVLGAPERTVIAPLPPRHVEVEPIPDASSNAERLAAEADARRRRRAEEDAHARETNARREQQRRSARDERTRQETRDRERDRRDPRETDRELALDAPRPSPKEKTAPSAASIAGRSDRDDGRRRPLREPSAAEQSLVRQNTAIERVKADTPYTRFGVALRDVAHAIVESSKSGWNTLRTEGVKPFIVRMKPGAERALNVARGYWLRLRAAAVTKAVELGLVKPKRMNEYEQHGDDRLDQGRVDAWRKFHKGKTSSSYLQDDE